MKKTEAEEKAKRLWANYTTKQEEIFWQQYNELIVATKKTADQPMTAKKVIPAQTAETAVSKDITFEKYPIEIIMGGIAVITAIAGLIIYRIAQGSSEDKSGIIVFFVAVAAILIALLIRAKYKDISFKITPQALVINEERILWRTIDYITLQEKEEYDDEANSYIYTYQLLIMTHKSGVKAYPYDLLGLDHYEFFEHLHKHAKQVNEIDYKK